MLNCKLNGPWATLSGKMGLGVLSVISKLSGRKKWESSGVVIFENNTANIRLLQENYSDINFEDTSGELAAIEELANLPSQHDQVSMPRMTYHPKRVLADFQKHILALSWERKAYALFLDMGLRKTGTTIANIGMLFFAKRITGALIVAPRGVHTQWVNRSFPDDAGRNFNYDVILWKDKSRPMEKPKPGRLQVFAMNIDAIRTRPGMAAARKFLEAHKGKSFFVFDESHNIKTASSGRTESAWTLGNLAEYRRILTGTPISRNIADAWAQFMFLDPRILGHNTLTSFTNRFCVKAGFDNKQIVDQKNTEEFYRLIAPHSYRATKEELLDLPPKIYVDRPYEIDDKTKRHYDELKNTYMTQLDDGTLFDVNSALVAALRLQQIICGYLPSEDEEELYPISNQRIEEMMEIVRQVTGPVIIWARFTEDIRRIMATLEAEFGKGCAVDYYGGTKEKQKELNKQAFIDRKARFFVSNQAAGGTGLDGLQGIAFNVIYYSNSFNALHRWQSEDRTHRDGMIVDGKSVSVTYFDLMARRSVDAGIRRNLAKKKEASDLTLDDIRRVIGGFGDDEE